MQAEPAPSLYAKVAQDLSLIRSTMVRATAFEAVVGSAWILMGSIGLVGASVAAAQKEFEAWLVVWLGTAFVAASVGLVTTKRCADRQGVRLDSAPARRFWTLFLPPLLAACVLTLLFSVRGLHELVPGTWLLLYGFGLASGGSVCRTVVRTSGFAFQVLGLFAFVWPDAGNALLAAGFGAIHLSSGVWILRHEPS